MQAIYSLHLILLLLLIFSCLLQACCRSFIPSCFSSYTSFAPFPIAFPMNLFLLNQILLCPITRFIHLLLIRASQPPAHSSDTPFNLQYAWLIGARQGPLLGVIGLYPPPPPPPPPSFLHFFPLILSPFLLSSNFFSSLSIYLFLFLFPFLSNFSLPYTFLCRLLSVDRGHKL